MNLTIEQSYFGRSQVRPLAKTNIKSLFRRKAPNIIQFCNKQAKKMKPRNEFQSLLFTQDYQDEPSDDISIELKEHYRSEAEYPFYLSRCHLFIDNYHLKIMRKSSPIPIKFDCLNYGKLTSFAEWVGKPSADCLVGLTDRNWVIIVSTLQKYFFKYCIPNAKDGTNKKIISVNGHENYLFVFTGDEYHILEYKSKNDKNTHENLKFILYRKFCSKQIHKGLGIKSKGKYFIFALSGKYAYIWKPQEGFLRIDFLRSTFHEAQNNQLINNFAISLKGNIVMAAFATKSKVVIKKFDTKSEMISLMGEKTNPYKESTGDRQRTYLSFIQRDGYVLCAMGFRYQLFFMKLWPDAIFLSKRIKFANQIEFVGHIGSTCGIVVILDNKLSKPTKKTVILTHESKIVSFSSYVNLQALEKYTLEVEMGNPLESSEGLKNLIMVYRDQEVFMLQKCSIQRAVLSSWEDIYNEMKITENIKLLKFLILLKLSPSPFLSRPADFEGLQSFFPKKSAESRRILLEYYYIMEMSPKLDIFTDPIILPFIIEHRISNLPAETQQQLMNYCLQIDQRLVEQMIIGGAECGWQFAVRNGWVRAFKVMVQNGMEMEMPILKLYSMAIYTKRVKINQHNQRVQALTEHGYKHLSLMVDYIIFILRVYFKDLQGNGLSIQFKQIFEIIFKPQIWIFMVRFMPASTVQIISCLFLHSQMVKQMNQYSREQIGNFQQVFQGLVPQRRASNSDLVFSHLSQSYLCNNPESSHLLCRQHSKIMAFRYQQFKRDSNNNQENQAKISSFYQLFNLATTDKAILIKQLQKYKESTHARLCYSFKKDYLKSILFQLIKHESKAIKDVFAQLSDSQAQHPKNIFDPDQLCQMADFLVQIWFELCILIIQEAYRERKTENEAEIKKAIRQQVRLLLSDIEQENYREHYLILNLMTAINSSNEYTVRIFHRYLRCENPLLKARIFRFLRRFLPESPLLQEEFIKNLKGIIEIDKEECRLILETLFTGRQKQIIRKMDNDPSLQLRYVELILKEGAENIESYYTNLHIELLLKIKPEQLVATLTKNSQFVRYDISEALRIILASKDFDQKEDVLIYLYESEGEIVKCVNTYLSAMEKLVMNYISIEEEQKGSLEDDWSNVLSESKVDLEVDQVRGPDVGSEVLEELEAKFNELTKLIYRQLQSNYQLHKICLDKFTEMILLIKQQNHRYKEEYLLLISTLFGNYIIQIFEHNALDYFSRWIQQYQGKMQFCCTLLEYLVKIYDKIQVEIATLKSTVAMERNILVSEIKSTLKLLQFCISSDSNCSVCLKSLKKEEGIVQALLFNCGHLYHRGCIDPINGQDFCYYCVSKNQYKSMIDNDKLNLVDLLKRFRDKRNQMKKSGAMIQIKQRQTLISLNQKRANRLKLFDKKVTSIETQAQIIDLKMVIEEYYSQQDKK